MSKYVEAKFRKIKLLMQFLTLVKKLCEEFNCKNLFGFNGYELQKKIYKEIAKQAE
jgi:hypothetical protein